MSDRPLQGETWQVAIAGLGLIGASIGLDLRARGHRVLGLDREAGHLQRALQIGAIDAALGADPQELDIAVLAAPPAANIALLRRDWRARLVIDTSSVKAPISSAAQRSDLPFVGGHPLAGTAGGGPEAALPGLFRGTAFLLTPGRGPLELAQRFALELGADPVVIDADAHDRLLARTSHLVYLMSCTLADVLGEIDPRLLGPAAREMLRVATSPVGMWEEILELNGPDVDGAIREAGEALARLAKPEGRQLEALRTAAIRLRGKGNAG